jgi:hypothetical protein
MILLFCKKINRNIGFAACLLLIGLCGPTGTRTAQGFNEDWCNFFVVLSFWCSSCFYSVERTFYSDSTGSWCGHGFGNIRSLPLRRTNTKIGLTFSKSSYSHGGWRARWDLNPGSPAPQASVIIRTRPRAHRDGLRYYAVPKYEVFSFRNSFVSAMSVTYWNPASISCVASSIDFAALQIYSSFCGGASNCV